jgi:O-antigen ligase/Flp pilus assembly protein TadD
MTLKSIARWAVLIPLFAIPFIPLYVANELFFPFITGKGFLFRILVEIALVGLVVLAFLDKKYRPTFSWTLALYAALAGWMVIANALAVNPHKAFWSNFERMDGFVTLVHVFAFFIVLGTMLTVEKLWRKWWLFLVAGATMLCGYALLQLAGLAEIHQGSSRVDASIGNAAYLAVYLLFATAISLWQGLESKGWVRYTLLSISALCAFIIFATATRGAVIGLAGAIGLGSILWILEAGKKKTRLAAGGVLLGLLVLVGAFFALKETPFIKQDPTLSRIASISAADGATRFTLWSMAAEGIAERPIFGWGQEGFIYVFQEQYRPSLFAQEPWFDRAHNTYIDWLIAGGIPALLLFLALLVSAVVALFRKTVSRPERIILIAALAAYAFQAIFVFDNLMSYIGLAALLAAAHAASGKPIKRLVELPEMKGQTAAATLAPVAITVGVALVWMVNVPSIAQASRLVQALGYSQQKPAEALALFKEATAEKGLGDQEVSEQFLTFAASMRSRTDVPEQLRTDIIVSALTRMQEQVVKTPTDARLRVQYATGLRALGQQQKALEESGSALVLSPKKQTIMMERGFELWEAGKKAEARDLFRAMYELDPSFKDLATYAAAGEIMVGNVDQGRKILTETFNTTHVDSEVLIVAYYEAKQYNDLVEVLKLRLLNRPGPESYLRLASGYAVAGRFAEARATAQEAIQKHPEASREISAFIQKLP